MTPDEQKATAKAALKALNGFDCDGVVLSVTIHPENSKRFIVSMIPTKECELHEMALLYRALLDGCNYAIRQFQATLNDEERTILNQAEDVLSPPMNEKVVRIRSQK